MRRTVGINRATVGSSALNSAAPALGLAVAGRQSRDGLVVNKDCLGVVSGRLLKLVWK